MTASPNGKYHSTKKIKARCKAGRIVTYVFIVLDISSAAIMIYFLSSWSVTNPFPDPVPPPLSSLSGMISMCSWGPWLFPKSNSVRNSFNSFCNRSET